MIIVKIKERIPTAEFEILRKHLQEAFNSEKVLLLGFDCEIIFRDEGKNRCAYCGQLNEKENNDCKFCGGRL